MMVCIDNILYAPISFKSAFEFKALEAALVTMIEEYKDEMIICNKEITEICKNLNNDFKGKKFEELKRLKSALTRIVAKVTYVHVSHCHKSDTFCIRRSTTPRKACRQCWKMMKV